MIKRPKLSDESFLRHLFSPKKNALPTGLRKYALKPGSGRKATRLNAYNKTSAVNQELLRRSGLREAYLKGEATLADAKRALRPDAIARGFAKPVKTRAKAAPKYVANPNDEALVLRLAAMIHAGGKEFSVETIAFGVSVMSRDQQADAYRMTYDDIKHAAIHPESNVRLSNGGEYNPFWYH